MDVDDLDPIESTDDSPRLSALVATADDVDEPAPSDDSLSEGTCTICGLDGPVLPISGTNGVFSDAFTTDPQLDWGDGVCWRCDYMAGAMDYRRYHWLATPEEVRVIKERPELIDALLDPPDGPWMAQYKDGSDFLTVLNGWIAGQRVNTSRDRFRLIVDKETVDFERDRFAEMIEFGRELRSRDDPPAKRTLLHGPTSADFDRYSVSREDWDRLVGNGGHEGLVGREDWRIVVQLID